MSIFTGPKYDDAGLQRNELWMAAAEVAAIFAIFIIAITGRSTFGDGVKQMLTVLSVIVGALGAVAGAMVFLRGIQMQTSRVARFALGGFMAFIGIYTIIHVL